MGRVPIAPAIAAILLLCTASAALACEPYTFGADEYGLERGIAWAFRGRVVRETVDAELGRTSTVVIAVDQTLRGNAAGPELTIEQDPGCDRFWFGTGDEVVVAIPSHPGPSWPVVRPPVRPPYAGLTNYGVAVWVLDGERVVQRFAGTRFLATIHGERPRTLSDLVLALVSLPDTATDGPTQDAPGDHLPFLAGAVALVAAFVYLPRRNRRVADDEPGLQTDRR